jgi:hypothetical protein
MFSIFSSYSGGLHKQNLDHLAVARQINCVVFYKQAAVQFRVAMPEDGCAFNIDGWHGVEPS